VTEKKNPDGHEPAGGNAVIYGTGGASITGYDRTIPEANFPLRVLSISPRHDHEVVAVATVAIGPFELRGLRVVRRSTGRLAVEMPKVTTPSGAFWRPITITEPEILECISDAVLACYRDRLVMLGSGTGGRR
jgi:DNA-binding cell septation regulator SpoVG